MTPAMTPVPRELGNAVSAFTLMLIASGILGPGAAAAGGLSWPSSADRPVADPYDYGTAALACSPAGDLYVAMSRFEASGSIAVEVLRSFDSGTSFEPYGSFSDPNPEHTFASPSLVYLTDPDRLVLALLEQIEGAGYAVRVARTLVGPTADWQLVTIGAGQILSDPQIVVDPWAADRLYLIYRALVVDGDLSYELDFARSTDGGASWSQPITTGDVVLPEEMTSASVMAGPDSVVHVAWVATGAAEGVVFHRRHLRGGDPSLSFEPPAMIVGPATEAAEVILAGGSGPQVLAFYLSGDGALRTAWSADAGAVFSLSDQLVVSAFEVPDDYDVVGEGEYAHIVYRAGGIRLRYRPLLVADPTQVGDLSLVSEIGEPAERVDIAMRRDAGPGAVWFVPEGQLARPFLDAYWFQNTGIAPQDGGPMAGAAPPAVMVAAPNPFRSRTAIELQMVEAAAEARLTVVSPAGRVVAMLHAGPLPAGRARFLWDGRDAGGQLLPAGVYYLKATFPGGSTGARAVLLR